MHRLNVVRECGTGGATRRFRSALDGYLACGNYPHAVETRPFREGNVHKVLLVTAREQASQLVVGTVHAACWVVLPK